MPWLFFILSCIELGHDLEEKPEGVENETVEQIAFADRTAQLQVLPRKTVAESVHSRHRAQTT